jgi:ankyrin repeat protein
MFKSSLFVIVIALILYQLYNINNAATDLFYSCYIGDIHEITHMITDESLGLDINNAHDMFGNSCLHWLVKGNNLAELKHLINEQMINVNVKELLRNNQSTSILHWSMPNGSEEMIEYILETFHDINVDEQNKNGETPLHWACDWNNDIAVDILLKNDADPNKQDAHGNVPLHKVSKDCHENIKCTSIVASMMSIGSDITIENNYKRSPLQYFEYSKATETYNNTHRHQTKTAKIPDQTP